MVIILVTCLTESVNNFLPQHTTPMLVQPVPRVIRNFGINFEFLGPEPLRHGPDQRKYSREKIGRVHIFTPTGSFPTQHELPLLLSYCNDIKKFDPIFLTGCRKHIFKGCPLHTPW